MLSPLAESCKHGLHTIRLQRLASHDWVWFYWWYFLLILFLNDLIFDESRWCLLICRFHRIRLLNLNGRSLIIIVFLQTRLHLLISFRRVTTGTCSLISGSAGSGTDGGNQGAQGDGDQQMQSMEAMLSFRKVLNFGLGIRSYSWDGMSPSSHVRPFFHFRVGGTSIASLRGIR